MLETKSTCPYCGVGCGVIIQTQKDLQGTDQVVGVRGDPDHPANFGKLCTKGSTLHLTAASHLQNQARLLYPTKQLQRQNPERILSQRISWDEAIQTVAQKFAEVIQTHGPDAVAIYVSGQILTEDYYIFNKISKGLIGTNNIDTNSRLCMSSAVAGYKQTLGMDAPPCCYEDIDDAKVFFITGSNTAFAHPILYRRLEEARQKDSSIKVIVVDPRKTSTAKEADLHLQISPGTDVALHHGMLHIMLWEKWTDESYIAKFTEGFEALKELVRDYTPKIVAQVCGIAEQDLYMAAEWFAKSPATLSLYCQGLNQAADGTAKNATLINLHLATGQIGRIGAGPFSLTGQPNAMGGREVGGLANLLSAHRNLSNAQERNEVASFWGVKEVPAKPGLSAIPMFSALKAKQIKAIWIVCTNPAQSMPDQQMVHEALRNAEFVVVQEAFKTTATCQYADILLPATTWAEKIGTVTNSERRISLVRPAIPPRGESKHDWQIALEIAKVLEQLLPSRHLDGIQTLFPYQTVEDIWNEHRALTRGRDLDITGLSYEILDKHGPQQWPMPADASMGLKRLYEDGIFPTRTGKAQFMPTPYFRIARPVNARFPFALTTGRLRDHWHGMSRTGMLGTLFAHVPTPYMEISPKDAHRLQLEDDDLAYITSQQGSEIFPIKVSEDIASSQVYIPMHWGSEFVSGNAGKNIGKGVNGLTSPVYDPVSEQPELKYTAVKILKAELPWKLVAFGYFPKEKVLLAFESMKKQYAFFGSAYACLFGREQDQDDVGIYFQAAHIENPFIKNDLKILGAVQDILKIFSLYSNTPNVMGYQDKRLGVMRMIRTDNTIKAVLLAGANEQLQSKHWLKSMLDQGLDANSLGRMLLAPTKEPPIAMKVTSPPICNCLNVTTDTLLTEIKKSKKLSKEDCFTELQEKTQCATNCGSCKPEIKKLIDTVFLENRTTEDNMV
jgi:assimilatory nitrate reductase catalytic subunit